ncbi:MAG: hypothetical protein IKP62_09440 [Salinivirgaceae bacterium]|nr:hypothetical protein [Salinivirgaceae bacterium]
MRNNSFFCLILAAAIFVSCNNNDVTMQTTINANGTCTRAVSYKMVEPKSDSAAVPVLSTPIPDVLCTDSLWTSSTRVDGDTLVTTFTRDFQTVEQMSGEMPLQINGQRLKAVATLDKRFRWFYTEYTFSEVFASVGSAFPLPITDYVGQDTASFWFTGYPNLMQGLSGSESLTKLGSLEIHFNKWLNDNMFKLCFDYIVGHYESVSNPPVSREKFASLRDSLARSLNLYDAVLDIDEANKRFSKFFHSDAYAVFFNEDNPLGGELIGKYKVLMNIFWFSADYTLSMPGNVIDCGTGICQNGTIIYPLTGERMIPQSYTITATSRVKHTWAYVAMILIVAMAVCGFVFRRKKI